MVQIVVCGSYDEMSRAAAKVIEEQVAAKPDCVLGLATGSTPIGLYAELVRDVEAGALDLGQVTTFNLDEYRGLSGDHPQSYRYFMNENLFGPIGFDAARTHLPDGGNPDAEAECAAYERAIEQAGGIDLQLLGIGHNGHIGFNEPSSEFPEATHVVELTESTISANSRLFDSADEVPREAYTMGIGTIMRARRVLLVANGADKAKIVAAALNGPVTPEVPASILQQHADVTVVLDEEAASCL